MRKPSYPRAGGDDKRGGSAGGGLEGLLPVGGGLLGRGLPPEGLELLLHLLQGAGPLGVLLLEGGDLPAAGLGQLLRLLQRSQLRFQLLFLAFEGGQELPSVLLLLVEGAQLLAALGGLLLQGEELDPPALLLLLEQAHLLVLLAEAKAEGDQAILPPVECPAQWGQDAGEALNLSGEGADVAVLLAEAPVEQVDLRGEGQAEGHNGAAHQELHARAWHQASPGRGRTPAYHNGPLFLTLHRPV